jgi:hypothetical protein
MRRVQLKTVVEDSAAQNPEAKDLDQLDRKHMRMLSPGVPQANKVWRKEEEFTHSKSSEGEQMWRPTWNWK